MLRTLHGTEKDVEELRELSESLESASDAESAAMFASQTHQLVTRSLSLIVAAVRTYNSSITLEHT